MVVVMKEYVEHSLSSPVKLKKIKSSLKLHLDEEKDILTRITYGLIGV